MANAASATATASINITVGSLAANDDNFSAAPINPVTGGSTPSVLLNDALNGSTPPAAADVLLSLTGAPAGISLNPDGTVTVAAGVPAGGRTLTYQLCEAAAPGNCANATLRLVVAPSAIDDALSTPAGVVLTSSVAGNDKVGSGAGLGDDPRRRTIVDEMQLVLDMAVRAEDERGRGLPRGEVLDMLAGEAVQPAEAVGTGDPQDVAVRQVHEALSSGQAALLGVEGAVVRGDRGVDAVTGDGSGQGEEGAGHASSLGRKPRSDPPRRSPRRPRRSRGARSRR